VRSGARRSIVRSLRLTCLVAAGLLVVAASTQADGHLSQRTPTVLHLRFQRVINDANGSCDDPPVLRTSGHYALVPFGRQPSQPHCGTGFLLLDDRTGKRRVIHVVNLGSATLQAFGAPWILFATEGAGEQLYNIHTRKLQPLPCNASCMAAFSATEVYELGSRWLEFEGPSGGPCGDGIHYDCGPLAAYGYLNLITHEVRKNWSPTGNRRIVDLDSATLVRTVCQPLGVPTGGSLRLYGKFAVATQADGSSFLEQCGSQLNMPLDGPYDPPSSPSAGVSGNDHAVTWQVLDQNGLWHGQLDGVLLPSLQRFTASIPSYIADSGGPAGLDSSRMYFVSGLAVHAALWAAPFPPSKRCRTRRVRC
jgi:hypothetical protein